MQEIKKCLHQVFRPNINIDICGWGNCLICKSDDKNKQCKGYYEIVLRKIKEQ